MSDQETLKFIKKNLWLIALPCRPQSYDVLSTTNINYTRAKRLAEATEECWQAIKNRDVKSWGASTVKCFEAQLEMYPKMLTLEMADAIERYRSLAYGWKVTGCGGGGYLVLISDKIIPNAIQVLPCEV